MVGGFGESGVGRVPGIEKHVAALFHPAGEISGGDLVWPIEERVLWLQYFHGRGFIYNSGAFPNVE